jgi:hypothetical protein
MSKVGNKTDSWAIKTIKDVPIKRIDILSLLSEMFFSPFTWAFKV